MLWLFGILTGLVLLTLLISYICFCMAFKAKPDINEGDEYPIPPGKIYEPHRDTMRRWMDMTRQLPCREFSITSYDGLKLYGKYYECQPGAPIELMFHGYRGLAERDLCGGVQRCFQLGRNALLVDQRSAGKSDGNVITFGIKERWDCVHWAEFMAKAFPDSKLILTGISMGASTVLMASALPLPESVVGIIADCGFTSAKEIIQKVIRQLHLPAKLAYPFVRLGAKLWGGFDPEEASAMEAIKMCRLPVFLAHGEDDDYVPCQMSIDNYNVCSSPKQLFTVPGAGHGLCYMIDKEGYLKALREIEKQY